jgi:sucrose-6-phosphate hydrolase SacC (GH32 family)
MQKNIKRTALILFVIIGAGIISSVARETDNPLKVAKVVWDMKTLKGNENYPLTLKGNGFMQVEKLNATEYTESLKRGGSGFAVVLNNQNYLSLNVDRAKTLRPGCNAVTLYTRAWVGPDGEGALFFSDFLALAIHPSGLAIGFLGVKTPHGKVYRELPLAMLERGGWLDLALRVGSGHLDFFCNGVLKCTIPVNQGLSSPFDDVLQIGAFGGGICGVKPFRNGKISAVALWDRALLDNQVAFLSGVESVRTSGARNPMDQAIQDYNKFFDASLHKDTTYCGRLWKSIRELANKDPFRPIYHLTQPLGHIYDPVGAYYYGGRYHVFSYHNIFSLLNYCSLDHYISDDLVRWTQWPIGPWADSDLDVYGIWLMNHFIDDKGVPSVIYTAFGTNKHAENHSVGILARSRDGLVSYKDKKAVLTKYHHDGHTWKEGNTWYTITALQYNGGRPGKLGDAVMLWSSSDLEHWLERGEIFARPKEENAASELTRKGSMEFPYLLSFGNKDVLILGGPPVRYWVGKFDRQQLKFTPDKPDGLLLDDANPFHCFNPLCVDQKGPGGTPRRIVMAMFNDLNGGGVGLLPWFGVHAMPRSLELEGDHLHQEPLQEMQSLRGDRHSQQNITVIPNVSGYINKRGDAVEIIADFEPGDARCFGLKVRLSDNGSSFVRIYFDTVTSEFGVDGKVMPAKGRGPSFISKGQPVRMHVFLDKLLVEAFVNGQTCTTAAQDRNLLCDGIDLFSEGGSARCKKLDIWNMELK